MTTPLGRVIPIHKGEYTPTTEYQRMDIISYDGSSYYVVADSVVGVTPEDGENYKLLSGRGPRGQDGIIGKDGNSGVYVGSGTPPEGTIVQVDFDGDVSPFLLPAAKTDEMTEPVGCGEDGKLYTCPYHVGDICFRTIPGSPAEIYGGTWNQIKGKFLLGATDDEDGSGSYPAYVDDGQPNIGGSEEHVHDISSGAALISLTGGGEILQQEGVWPTSYSVSYKISTGGSGSTPTGTTRQFYTKLLGDTKNASAMPPYRAVYIWERIA